MADGLFTGDFVLLHNPRCSKSRKLKALLEESGVAFREREYLKEPLNGAELAGLAKALGRPVCEWLREGEAAFIDTGLQLDAGDTALLNLMKKAPILIERPILIRGDRARVGRPPEDALELLD